MSDFNVIEYQGRPINFNDGFINLTDCWKAVGSPLMKRPIDWVILPQTKDFLKALMVKLNVGKSHLLQTKCGRYGSTMAHWQLVISYAKYLSPEFHMFVNEVFRNYVQQNTKLDNAKTESTIETSKSCTGSYAELHIKVKLPDNEALKLFTNTIKSINNASMEVR